MCSLWHLLPRNGDDVAFEIQKVKIKIVEGRRAGLTSLILHFEL
jgi:hypothetical protein